MAKKKETKNKKNEMKHDSWFTRLRQGRPLSLQFIRRHAWSIIIFTALALALTGLRYSVQSKMATIKQLQKEYRIAESKKLNAKAKYMSLIREKELKHLIREKGLDLDFREQPPYVISNNED